LWHSSFPRCRFTSARRKAKQPATAHAAAGTSYNSYLATTAQERKQEWEKLIAAKWNVGVSVLMVEVPEGPALELIPLLESADPAPFQKGYDQLMTMIRNKDAKLAAWPSILTGNARRAVVESIVEKTYPVSTEEPETPNKKLLVDHELSKLMQDQSQFETRNTGATLEAEAIVLGNGEQIAIQLNPQRVIFRGTEHFEPTDARRDGQRPSNAPQFAITKVATSVVVKNGSRVLLCVHKLDPPGTMMELFILHATATKVGE
jgi:hypothetical protein